MVLVVADDPELHSSQNEQDSRNYAKFAKVPMFEPADSEEALQFTKLAFAASEQFDAPVMLRSTTRISHSKSIVGLAQRRQQSTTAAAAEAEKHVDAMECDEIVPSTDI